MAEDLNRKTPESEQLESPEQGQPEQGEQSAQKDEEKKKPRNIVTDFYDSLNISVRDLNIALVVLCVFIFVVIVLAAKMGA